MTKLLHGETFSGLRYYPTEPHTDIIQICDIAHALSNICRFNGHCSEFYSVAQHSVVVSELCPHNLRLDGLMHDASEAYIQDIITPIKRLLPLYTHIEHTWMQTIYEVLMPHEFHAISKEHKDFLKRADSHALESEAHILMRSKGVNWPLVETLNEPFALIDPLPPKAAEALFIRRWVELTGHVIS